MGFVNPFTVIFCSESDIKTLVYEMIRESEITIYLKPKVDVEFIYWHWINELDLTSLFFRVLKEKIMRKLLTF